MREKKRDNNYTNMIFHKLFIVKTLNLEFEFHETHDK